MVGIDMKLRPGEASIDFRLDNALREWMRVLTDHRDVASKDPHFFLSLIRVMSHQRAPLQQIMLVLEEATRMEPAYYQTYFDIMRLNAKEMAPHQVEALARYAAQKTKSTDGEGMYARVYWAAYQNLYGPAMVELPSLDWSQMKVGMRDVLSRYPDSWNLNSFALFACLRQDEETTRDYMRQIGDSPYLPAWGNKEAFVACRDWVLKPL